MVEISNLGLVTDSEELETKKRKGTRGKKLPNISVRYFIVRLCNSIGHVIKISLEFKESMNKIKHF